MKEIIILLIRKALIAVALYGFFTTNDSLLKTCASLIIILQSISIIISAIEHNAYSNETN